MKKIKFLILFISLFLLSGCSAEYNLTITRDTMEEDINAIFDKNKENDYAARMEKIKRSAYYNMDTRDEEYYEFKRIDSDDKIILNYKYTYLDNDLYKSEAFTRCYYKRIVNVTDENITINTDKQVSCLYKDGDKEIDNITVNVKTKLPVLENNADKVLDNTYTWYIDDSNYTNKSIYIKIDKTIKDKENVSDLNILILVLGAIVVGIIIYLIIRFKHNKNNKIS